MEVLLGTIPARNVIKLINIGKLLYSSRPYVVIIYIYLHIIVEFIYKNKNLKNMK